jgi:hypothetical protein
VGLCHCNRCVVHMLTSPMILTTAHLYLFVVVFVDVAAVEEIAAFFFLLDFCYL